MPDSLHEVSVRCAPRMEYTRVRVGARAASQSTALRPVLVPAARCGGACDYREASSATKQLEM